MATAANASATRASIPPPPPSEGSSTGGTRRAKPRPDRLRHKSPANRPNTYGPYPKAVVEKGPPGGQGWEQPEFGMKWMKDEDIEAFADALAADPDIPTPLDHPSPKSHRVEHISAISDFAPIKQRIKRTPRRNRDIVREGWAYHLVRWPLLGFLSLAISVEFFCYVAVRQFVNFIEWSATWRGRRGELRTMLRQAPDYDAWKLAALELDEFLGFDRWKRSNANAYYDSSLVRRIVEELQKMREKDDAEGVRAVLEVCLRSNFAGVESFRLYAETFLGTKELIERYVDEVERAIKYINETEQLSVHEKTHFFKVAAKNFGTSALCLSGGASFGYYHFGVIRALLDAKLLPSVITGTSAGAVIAAFLCTHTDAELSRLLTPTLADVITACEEPTYLWLQRFWKTGARFDAVDWAKKSAFFTMGNMTFLEAYERTGRILNVSVIPYDTHSPTKLLNYVTAPHCVIFSAIIASAAVPGFLNPVVLMDKTKDGTLRPWEFQGRHKDGSLRVDVPLESLHLYFNTVYSIVSQVNPHIHLPRGAPGRPVAHRRGKGWRGGFFLSALEQVLKIELTKNFRVMRDLELMPEFAGQNWTAVFLQKYEGSVTIWPKSRAWDWVRILTDPDRKELARMIDVGKRVTWPKLHMIENRLRLERQIFQGRQQFGPINGDGGFTPRPRYDMLESLTSSDTEITTSASERPHHVKRSQVTKSNSLESAGGGGEVEARVKRRRSIMRKLGIVGTQSVDSESTPAEEEEEEVNTSFSKQQRRLMKQKTRYATSTSKSNEQTLRRRFSLGALKLAEPIRGARQVSIGLSSSSSNSEGIDSEEESTSYGYRDERR